MFREKPLGVEIYLIQMNRMLANNWFCVNKSNRMIGKHDKIFSLQYMMPS